MFRSLIAAAALAAATAGCAMPAVQTAIPNPVPGAKYNYADPADDCAPGEIVVESGEDAGCDLVGGSNTLTVIDVDREWCDWSGGSWTSSAPFPAGECHNVDF